MLFSSGKKIALSFAYGSSMDPAEAVLREIEQYGRRSFIPIIGPKKGKILVDAILEHRPKAVLEIGTFIGYSAILMAKHLPEGARITTIEIDPRTAEDARRNIERAGLSHMITLLVGDAKALIPSLPGPFDLVFIDAAKEQYRIYLKMVEDKLHAGSVLVADNAGIFAKEMSDYLNYVRHSGRYRSTYHPSTLEFRDDVVDGVEVSVKL